MVGRTEMAPWDSDRHLEPFEEMVNVLEQQDQPVLMPLGGRVWEL